MKKKAFDSTFSVKLKKRAFLVLLVALSWAGAKPVYAAEDDVLLQQPQSVLEADMQSASLKSLPTSLRELFDAEYYASLYPDVALSLGLDKEMLFQHFLKFGLAEGRACSKYFDIASYCSMNRGL